MKAKKIDFLIIGAGISGLTIGRRLHDAGRHVLVLEKGRGFGGRMATRGHGRARFDHGAQYFTVRTPEFQVLVDHWLEIGVVKEWFRKLPEDTSPNGHPRYIGVNGISAVAKYLATDLDVRRECRAHKVQFAQGGWTVTTGEGDVYLAQELIVTAPVPQAMELLETAHLVYPEEALEGLRAVRYERGLAVMAVLAGPSGLSDFGGVKMDGGGPVSWLADNQMKGISPEAFAVTLHSTPAFAEEHWESLDLVRGPALIEAARPFLKSPVTEYFCHRWGYALPIKTFGSPFLHLPAYRLLLVGDSFGGPRVEGAVSSGLAGAAHLLGSSPHQG